LIVILKTTSIFQEAVMSASHSPRLLSRISIPLFFALLLILITAVSLQAAPVLPVPTADTLTGWFSIICADGKPGTPVSFEEYWLTEDNGKTTQLQIDPALLESLGGSLALNGQRVQAQGTWLADGRLHVESLQPEISARAAAPTTPAVTGSQPWITLPCKFADMITETKPIAYFTQMYTSTYPGLDHYWREVSYNLLNVQGSGSVSHWYTLPQPQSYYQVSGGSMDTAKLFQDCTAAADAEVYFPNYVGINMVFNGDFPTSKGGSGTATLDGVTRSWRRTWLADWGFSNLAVVEHEMGHGFGLTHSSGNYGATYDNVWDVMSDTWTNCWLTRDPVFGCLGQHTIGWHKDLEGWIPLSQKAVITAGTHVAITLERTALPQTSNYLVAVLPVKATSDRFYTLEARRKVGYDTRLPGEGVVIHYVEIGRSNPARVIDIDGNGNTNDAGTIWVPGETFVDSFNSLTVTVVSATATGYVVNVDNQSFPKLYYVATTGSDSGNACANSAAPCATVQHAVDGADIGGEIRIAAGTYTGLPGITQTVYISKSIILRGGYTPSNWNTPYPLTQTTTLDAQNARRVIYIASGQPVVEGLRLINGNATGLGGAWGDGGGGIYVNSGASPTIRNCIIANSTAYHGGGIFLTQNNATLEGNIIISNTASLYGGGAISLYADGNTYTGNIIRANHSQDGGGLYLYGSEARLINNVITDNDVEWNGSGVYVRNAAPQLWHTTIARNTAQWGSSSGIYLEGSTPTLINTILVGHDIGVYANASSTATLTATVWGSGVWANTLDTSGGGSVSIGTANIHGDPAFVSATTGDYHLTQASAAIDQGAPSDVDTDIDNQARPNGSVSDIGADEWYKLVNHAPATPSHPTPTDGELNVWVLPQLGWQSSDADGDGLTYTVALGSSNPPSVVGQTTSTLFSPGKLLTNTHYYWKITATDGVSVTVGPLWEFTTRNDATISRIYLPLVRK
jgi:M6 family metalloprotease-like protein